MSSMLPLGEHRAQIINVSIRPLPKGDRLYLTLRTDTGGAKLYHWLLPDDKFTSNLALCGVPQSIINRWVTDGSEAMLTTIADQLVTKRIYIDVGTINFLGKEYHTIKIV